MIEVIKGDTRSLDFTSYRMCRVKGIPNSGTILGGLQKNDFGILGSISSPHVYGNCMKLPLRFFSKS